MLRKHKIHTVFKPTKKIQDSLRSVKDKRDLLTSPGVYSIPCTCGKVYVGTTKRSINTRIQEHKRHCRLLQPEKSAVAQHTLLEQGNHTIKFEDTKLLATTPGYHARLQREAIEIFKHPKT